MNRLDGLTAIVTGAGRGLGREHALLLAELGAHVVVNDNGGDLSGTGADKAPAQQVVEEITAAGGSAIAHISSVSDWDATKALVDCAVETYGGLDILVNNAGILRDRTIVQMSEEDWDLVLDVHVKGHFNVLKHAATYWRNESKAGRQRTAAIVNTTSGSGLKGNVGQANYASAKAGIAVLTVVAARELERYGVRSNAIAPVARTRLTMSTPGLADRLAATAQLEFDEWDPAHIAPLVAWLVSPRCQVSGRVFSIRGGLVEMHDQWPVVETFRKDGAWTVDELEKAMADLPAGPPSLTASA